MLKKHLPTLERLVAFFAGLLAIIQAALGNIAVGLGLALFAVAILVFAYKNRRRVLSLESCLQDEIGALVDEEKHLVAIRWAECTSRALWLNGSYRARVQIGKQAIKAADAIGQEAIRPKIRALIDDCGWTSIEMGMLREGENWLLEGIRLAEKHDWAYMYAKGLRHLGGKHLRNHDFAKAEVTLREAHTAATALPSGLERDELLAEWHYAQSVLQLARGDIEAASQSISSAERAYAVLPSKEWRAKIQVRKGEIEFKSGDRDRALGIFSEASSVADKHDYRRVLVKAQIWLARVHLDLGQVHEATTALKSISRIVQGSEMLQEQREISSLRTEIRQHTGYNP